MAKLPRTRPGVSTKKAAKRRAAAKPARSAKPVRASKPNRKGKPAGRPNAGRPAPVRSAAKRQRPVPKPAASKGPRARPVVPPPDGPSSHDLALRVFEQGFAALQSRQFKEAAALLASIIDRYPDEKELHERARVYVQICERQAASASAPRTLEERVNSATVAINRGAYEEALRLLRPAEREDGENDLVPYMLAVVHAGLGHVDAAIPYLRQAVELNDANRHLAAQDEDLEPLRQHPEFAALLESPPSTRRRPAARAARGGR